MQKSIILFLLLLTTAFFNGCSEKITSPELYKSIKILEENNPTLSIDSVISLKDSATRFKRLKDTVNYSLKEKKVIWLYIRNTTLSSQKYLSVWSPYTEYAKPYIYHNHKVLELHSINQTDGKKYNSLNRFPSWKLPILKGESEIFIKIEDSKRATGLKILLQEEADYLTFVKLDYFKISFISVLLLSMLIIVTTLFIARKQKSLIWYAFYITTFIIEFLISQGVDQDISLISSPIVHSTKKILFQSIGGFFIGMFFLHFYNFTKETFVIKKIFKLLVYLYLFSFLIVLSFIIFNNEYLPKIYIWLPQRIGLLIILFAHLYLVKKQKLPFYLGISFTFPIIGYFIFAYFKVPQTWNLLSYFLIENTLYIAIVLEMIFMIFYIINQIVKNEFQAIKLREENLNLRTNFQDTILKVQEEEKNKLLSNVHDSFGGYLEALKIRLSQKKDPEKINEILNSFYKEYRFLLNNLYAPKLNSSNFINSLEAFIKKINTITNNLISYNFSIKETEISSEKCIHIYRILSELITNAIKHAKANEVNVNLYESKEKQIVLEVIDDGKGFENSNKNINSYGIQSIKSRLSRLHGDIEIESKRNKGSKITIKIPN